jgi:hypothetical protein
MWWSMVDRALLQDLCGGASNRVSPRVHAQFVGGGFDMLINGSMGGESRWPIPLLEIVPQARTKGCLTIEGAVW